MSDSCGPPWTADAPQRPEGVEQIGRHRAQHEQRGHVGAEPRDPGDQRPSTSASNSRRTEAAASIAPTASTAPPGTWMRGSGATVRYASIVSAIDVTSLTSSAMPAPVRPSVGMRTRLAPMFTASTVSDTLSSTPWRPWDTSV